jgi:anti-anti-sigma factor
MEIRVRDERGVKVAEVEGRIDTATSRVFEQRCAEVIDGGARKMALDLAAVAYISSAGLSSVLAVVKRMGAAGGAIVVCGLTGVVKEVFAISGFDTIMPVVPDLARALEGLG